MPNNFILEWGNGNMIPMGLSFNEGDCIKDDVVWSGSLLPFQGYEESFPSQGFGQYKKFIIICKILPEQIATSDC